MLGKPVRLGTNSPQFVTEEVPIDLARPLFLSFVPLWQTSGGRGPPLRRRLALGSETAVHVYRLEDPPGEAAEECDGGGESAASTLGSLRLECKLDLPAACCVTALCFGERGDEGGARRAITTIVVATAPVEGVGGKPIIRVWACDTSATPPPSARDAAAAAAGAGSPEATSPWLWDKDYLASLDDHTAPVRHLALSTAYLVSGDAEGWVRVWDKPRQYVSSAAQRLAGEEAGGLADLVTDRHFVYTIGKTDLTVKISTVPDLKFVNSISTTAAIQGFLASQPMAAPLAAMAAVARQQQQQRKQLQLDVAADDAADAPKTSAIARLTGLRRPISRWSGAQPTKNVREGGPPRGLLFVSGQLNSGSGTGSSFLMVWSLKAQPDCHAVELAHDSSIACISYGPYDNGPLVTADTRGVFWVWEYTPRLVVTQEVDAGCFGVQSPVMAVDPSQRAVYAIVGGGDSRLFVWRQQHSTNPRLAATTSP